MNDFRTEILRATREASTVFRRFPTGNRTSFDIVEAVTESKIPLLFRPLGGLWGAAITAEDQKGIMVTTKVGLPIQRFTLAHELGHILLGHNLSLDKEVEVDGRFGAASLPVEERAANIFASELLAPKKLIFDSASRHAWDRQALRDPINVYQLALRLGVSYKAACWALASHKIFDADPDISIGVAKELQKVTVKDLKSRLASLQYLKNAWADVWKLSENDSGTFLEAGADDLFVLHLKQNAAAGYLWELIDAGEGGQVLANETNTLGDLFGGYSSKTILLKFSSPGIHRLIFEHHRPWNGQQIGFIDISVTNFGKEEAGLPRRSKEAALMKEAA